MAVKHVQQILEQWDLLTDGGEKKVGFLVNAKNLKQLSGHFTEKTLLEKYLTELKDDIDITQRTRHLNILLKYYNYFKENWAMNYSLVLMAILSTCKIILEKFHVLSTTATAGAEEGKVPVFIMDNNMNELILYLQNIKSNYDNIKQQFNYDNYGRLQQQLTGNKIIKGLKLYDIVDPDAVHVLQQMLVSA
nr:hypothetical protein [Microctonus hyperodae filamentous virus]